MKMSSSQDLLSHLCPAGGELQEGGAEGQCGRRQCHQGPTPNCLRKSLHQEGQWTRRPGSRSSRRQELGGILSWTLALLEHRQPHPTTQPSSPNLSPSPSLRTERARGSLTRLVPHLRDSKPKPWPQSLTLSFPCGARHVGLPVPAPCLPGLLGYCWHLDRKEKFPSKALYSLCCVPDLSFSLAVVHKSVNLTEGFPYISRCGNYPPESCVFSQVLNVGAAMAAWICILRYHQLRDWGVRKCPNQMILWTGLLCALGTSIVGNFQEKNQRPVHLTGSFFAFFVGVLYFWLQVLLCWRMKSLPQPGAPWLGPLRLVLCSLCMVVLHVWLLRSASAACEWVAAMLLFILFGLFAVDFSSLGRCTLHLQPGPNSLSPPASPISLQVPL
uniref:Modulator of macroautophagy TMEM150B isoform X2 n=1 Tax=Camelus bactrianus TaxID=9837 RepID=A0A9W3GF50_CAMBA|nr:modulator of macroautophagy TMEM150B isoform X2 [Camelus bactrianus]